MSCQPGGNPFDVSAVIARCRTWAAQLEEWSDRPLTMLAVLLIPLLLAPFLFDLTAQAEAAFQDADFLVWSIFIIALAAGFIASPDRTMFLRRRWLDVLLVLIPLASPLRAGRSLFLVWAIAATGRALTGSRRLVARKGTAFLLGGASLVIVVAAGLIVVVEQDDPNATIHSYGDAFWWAMTTAATVGYGDKYPVTAAGRAIAVALMVLGITAFGVVTAHLAALFIEEQEDEARSQLRLMDERLHRIEALLVRRRAPATRRRRGRQARLNDRAGSERRGVSGRPEASREPLRR